MIDIEIQKILDAHPFLTYLIYGGNEYIGIVQNVDDVVTTIYDFGLLKDQTQKKTYLELGDQWWWESHRQIPINLFLKQDWVQFKFSLRTMNSKDVKIVYGPYVSLKEMASKRSKRRSITLVRRIV
jgi:hypothetical protein